MASTSGNDVSLNAATSPEDIETAKWTRHLPEAFGIRAAVQQSKYRWCVRESAMWAIATSTAMTLHRFRMQSPTTRAVHVGFTTFFVVYIGSYYFGVKRRDHRERMIELVSAACRLAVVVWWSWFHLRSSPLTPVLPKKASHDSVLFSLQMMKLNSFEHALNMPEPVPVDEQHPFVQPASEGERPKQYVAHLPERKEWQKQLPAQDFSEVFRPADEQPPR